MKELKYSDIYETFAEAYGQKIPWSFCNYPKVLKVPDLKQDRTLTTLKFQYEALIRYTRAQKLMIEKREQANLCYPCTIKIRKCQECGNLFKAGMDSKINQSKNKPCIVRKIQSKPLTRDQGTSCNRGNTNSYDTYKINNRKNLISWNQKSPCSIDKCKFRKSKISLINENCYNDFDDDISLLGVNQDIFNTSQYENVKFYNYNADTRWDSSDFKFKMLADNVYTSKFCHLLKLRDIKELPNQEKLIDSPVEDLANEIIIPEELHNEDEDEEELPNKKSCFAWFKNKMKKSNMQKKRESSKNKVDKTEKPNENVVPKEEEPVEES